MPNRHEPRAVRSIIDEEGRVDWRAFGAVDFPTMTAESAKARRLVLTYLRTDLVNKEHIGSNENRQSLHASGPSTAQG